MLNYRSMDTYEGSGGIACAFLMLSVKKSVACHHGTGYPVVADGGADHQTKVAVNLFLEQYRTDEMGLPSSLGLKFMTNSASL